MPKTPEALTYSYLGTIARGRGNLPENTYGGNAIQKLRRDQRPSPPSIAGGSGEDTVLVIAEKIASGGIVFDADRAQLDKARDIGEDYLIKRTDL